MNKWKIDKILHKKSGILHGANLMTEKNPHRPITGSGTISLHLGMRAAGELRIDHVNTAKVGAELIKPAEDSFSHVDNFTKCIRIIEDDLIRTFTHTRTHIRTHI